MASVNYNKKRIIAKSPLRYPGGKQKALRQIIPHIPESIGEYREPFIGGGSLFFEIEPRKKEIIKGVNRI